VREIDSLKSSTGRKAKRAPLANALMNRIIDSPNEEIEIRHSSPMLSIAIMPFARLREDEFPDLDLTIADHRLVTVRSPGQATNIRNSRYFSLEATSNFLADLACLPADCPCPLGKTASHSSLWFA
jgi:hypothetical protein